MKRIEYLKTDLSSLPLPQAGYKTIGIDTDGGVKTIDDQGNIEPIGGSASGSSFGKIGISDSNGEYTYYTTLTEAFAAATTGDTVKQFVDITETTDITVTVPSGVNWDLNGYTYTKTTTGGTANAVQLTGINRITNGKIICNGGGKTIFSTFATLFGYGLICENNTADVIDNNSGKVYGVRAISHSGGSAFGSFQQLYNCYAENTSSGYAAFRATRAEDCIFITSGTGIAFDAVENSLCRNITAHSAGSYGAVLGNSSTFENCNIYSSGFTGALGGTNIRMINCSVISQNHTAYTCNGSNTHYNTTFKSFGSVAFSLGTNQAANRFDNCTFESVVNYTMSFGSEQRAIFNNCVVRCLWNDVGGHGYFLGVNSAYIFGGTIFITNAGAKHIHSGGTVTGNKYANLVLDSPDGVTVTTPVDAGITNDISNTQDDQGNIIIN